MKRIKINLLKTKIRISFSSEEERDEFAKTMESFLSNETRLLGTQKMKRFYYLLLTVANNEEIGAMFHLLQKMGYESDEE